MKKFEDLSEEIKEATRKFYHAYSQQWIMFTKNALDFQFFIVNNEVFFIYNIKNALDFQFFQVRQILKYICFSKYVRFLFRLHFCPTLYTDLC